jgi:hypothetical protein
MARIRPGRFQMVPPAPERANGLRERCDRDRSGRQPLVLWIGDYPANHRGEGAALKAEGVTLLRAQSFHMPVRLCGGGLSAERSRRALLAKKPEG